MYLHACMIRLTTNATVNGSGNAIHSNGVDKRGEKGQILHNPSLVVRPRTGSKENLFLSILPAFYSHKFQILSTVWVSSSLRGTTIGCTD